MAMDSPPPPHETSDAASRSEADRSMRGGTNLPATVTTRRFSVDEYHRMAEAGVLQPTERVELIEGKIVQMAAIGSRHAECVDRLNRILVQGIEDRGTVRVQNPVRLSDHSEPEPDIALVRPRPEGYADRHPGPDDALLIVEVADTTLTLDREVKMPLYARAGIPECWTVDLVA
jgi:Uma2 family endonuclease